MQVHALYVYKFIITTCWRASEKVTQYGGSTYPGEKPESVCGPSAKGSNMTYPRIELQSVGITMPRNRHNLITI